METVYFVTVGLVGLLISFLLIYGTFLLAEGGKIAFRKCWWLALGILVTAPGLAFAWFAYELYKKEE